MRVALVCHEFRSAAAVDLGSHARGLASALASEGLEVEVFTLESCGRPRLTPRRRKVSSTEGEGSLADRVLAKRRFGWSELLDSFAQVTAAVVHLHSQAPLNIKGDAEAAALALEAHDQFKENYRAVGVIRVLDTSDAVLYSAQFLFEQHSQMQKM